MEKFGFVYIWRDRKHKRFYIGSHWGTEDDGYICSSTWMRNSYKRRPEDFKRKIISKIFSNRKQLLEEEHNWLNKIKPEELGKKYYNKTNHKNGHWSVGLEQYKIVKLKLQKSEIWKRKISESNLGKVVSIETKEKISKKLKGRKLPEAWKEKIKNNHASKKPGFVHHKPMLNKKHTVESKQKIRLAQLGEKNHMFGKKHSTEAIEKISKASSGRKMSEESKEQIKQKMINHPKWFFNHTEQSINKIKELRAKQIFSQEDKIKMSEAAKGRKWYKDLNTGKRVFYRESC